MEPKGIVESIAASGRIWAGFEAQEVRSMIFDSLKTAKNSIQVSTYTLGEKNDDMKEFFTILEEKLRAGKTVQMIVNDLKGESVGDYSKKFLGKLKKYPTFSLHDFIPAKKGDLLHAKIIVIDRKFVLIGSANISKHAMFSNYEIMLKISGRASAIIANLLDRLATAIQEGEEL